MAGGLFAQHSVLHFDEFDGGACVFVSSHTQTCVFVWVRQRASVFVWVRQCV